MGDWAEPSDAANAEQVFGQRPKLMIWIRVGQILYPIIAIWFTLAFVLCGITFITDLKKTKKPKNRSFIAIFAMATFMLIDIIYAIILVYVRFPPEEESTAKQFCELAAGPLIATIYVCAQGFSYVVFLTRTDVVEQSLQFDKIFQIAKLLAKIGTYVGVPILIIISWFIWESQLSSEGYCINKGNGIISLIYGLADSGLSFTFIFIFAVPLLRHTVDLSKLNSSQAIKMRKMTERNMTLSAIAIVSTFLTMGFMTIINVAFGSVDERYKYLQVTSHVIGTVDLFINSICVHLMTACWIPNNLQPYFACLYFSTRDRNTTRVASKSSKPSLQSKNSTDSKPRVSSKLLPHVSTEIVPSQGAENDEPTIATSNDEE